MSRYQLDVGNGPFRLVLGWDPTNHSYYCDVYDRFKISEALYTMGHNYKQFETVDALEENMLRNEKRFSLTDSLRRSLRRDRSEEGYPLPNETLEDMDKFAKRKGHYD